jgi:hypothetical protein
MSAWSRRATLAGVLLFTTMLVFFGMCRWTQAQVKSGKYENTRQTIGDPRLEPEEKQQGQAAIPAGLPAFRKPVPGVTQDSGATEKQDAQTSAEEPPARSTKEDETAPATLPARLLPDARPQAPAQMEPRTREFPKQTTPSTTPPKPLQQPPRPVEPFRTVETVTSPVLEQKVPPSATTRPWYEQSTPTVQQQPSEQPQRQQTSPPAASRPWYQQEIPVATPPLHETKQPRFGVPVQREQDAIGESPTDHRPVQQDVLSPGQQGLPSIDLNPCTRGTGDYPIPRVTGYDVQNGVSKGGRITFNGTNFLTDRIVVCLGDIRLETVSSSTNQLVVQAPQELIAGPLMISHGTSDSNYVLEENFRTIGDPVVTAIEPESFRTGDLVTVRGSDLSLYPLTTRFPESSTPNATVRFLKISTDSAHYGAGSFIKVHNYTRTSDMSKITFNVGEVFSQIRTYVVDGQLSDIPSYYGQSIAQPEVLSGPLRFNSGGSDRFDFAGPNVTWQRDADEFLLTAVKPPAWGDQHPMFVIVSADNPRGGIEIWFEGSGLDGARFRVGGELVAGGASAHGRDGFIVVKPSTPSGTVTATKNDVTISYPEPLTIIPAPAFLPGTLPPSPFPITIDEDYELRGWDLHPLNIPGLTYRLVLSGLDAAAETYCNITPLQIIDHTASTLRFKVASTGTVPSSCDSSTLFGGTGQTAFYVMKLVAELNGAERELWRMPYHLTR